MNDQTKAAMQMALDLLEMDEKYPKRIRGSYPKEVITALREALNTRSSSTHSDAEYSEVAQPQCNQHPDAPHGFDRNASHNADRYVCECESWEPQQGFRSINERIAELEQDPKMKAALDRARDRFANAGKVIEPSEYDREFWGDKPQGEWVDLTDDEVLKSLGANSYDEYSERELANAVLDARAVIAAFKEKNK